MNPWPDDYTEHPTEQAARIHWEALRATNGIASQQAVHRLGQYIHHLTSELEGLQEVCDQQHAELARRDLAETSRIRVCHRCRRNTQGGMA